MNRPLSCSTIIQENEGAERVIKPDQTYSITDPYVNDLSLSHEKRFIAQRNAVCGEADCIAQLGKTTILCEISSHFFDRSTRSRPFVMMPTDLHLGNILVDEEWNIKYLIDLEWFCALPI